MIWNLFLFSLATKMFVLNPGRQLPLFLSVADLADDTPHPPPPGVPDVPRANAHHSGDGVVHEDALLCDSAAPCGLLSCLRGLAEKHDDEGLNLG